MTRDEARAAVREALREVAPDADLDTLSPDALLRDDLELDSLDFENLVVRLSDRAGYRIDEDAYPRLSTIEGCIAYLASHGASVP